jgi:hypothetical protein
MRTPTFQSNQRLFADTPSDLGDSRANVQNIFRLEMLAASFLHPHQEDPTASMRIQVEQGNNVGVGGSSINFSGGYSPTFTPPGSGSRVDLLVLTEAGNLEILQGISGPNNYPADKRPICEVTLITAQTEILDLHIQDVRQFLGGGTNPNPLVITTKDGDEADDYPANTIYSVASGSYQLGTNSIRVYLDGILQTINEDFTENTTTTIRFVNPVLDTQRVTIIINDLAGFDLSTKVSKAGDIMTGVLTLPQLNFVTGTLNITKDGSDNMLFTDAFNASVTLSTLAAGGGGAATVLHDEMTAGGGETLWNLSFTYVIGTDELQIYKNGLLQREGAGNDYTETSTTSITFFTPLSIGDTITAHYIT